MYKVKQVRKKLVDIDSVRCDADVFYINGDLIPFTDKEPGSIAKDVLEYLGYDVEFNYTDETKQEI